MNARRQSDMANSALLSQMVLHTFPIGSTTKEAVKAANEQIRNFNAAITRMIEDD